MNFFQRKQLAIESWFERRSARFNHPHTPLLVSIMMPVLLGMMSLLLGQDDNWDMRNYHIYNAYALLNGRVGLDIAPGQFQSYFNPALDVLYYVLVTNLPAPVVGFIMGTLHGINFVLVLAIARLVLIHSGATNQLRVPVLLALAACFGIGFLSELGNTMGDNITAVFVLGALYLVLANWQRFSALTASPVAVLAGVCMGIGVGFKLTNAVYAVGLCLAFLCMPLAFGPRLRFAFLFGIGVVGGMAAASGFWFVKMWQLFQNPVFPTFNNVFNSPYVLPIGILDVSFLPKSVLERIFWPVIFTFNPRRVSELPLPQSMWLILFVLFALAAYRLMNTRPVVTKLFKGRWTFGSDLPAMDARSRFVLVFFGVSYLVWMHMFSIYRYLIPLELLAPLMVWILLHYIMQAQLARKLCAWLLVLVVAYSLPFITWGHTPWASKAFTVTQPQIPQPESSIVFTAHNDPPMGWLVPFMQKELLFVSAWRSMPESPLYIARVNAAIASRTGPKYIMLFAHIDHEVAKMEKVAPLIGLLSDMDSGEGCQRLDRLLRRTRVHFQVHHIDNAVATPKCRLELKPQYLTDLQQKNREVVEKADKVVARFGQKIDPASCQLYQAFIGKQAYPYQFCRVN